MRCIRAPHLETTGDGENFVEVLGLGASGDVYVAGRFGADRATLGADTLYARGEGNLFIAKYGATSLSSEPTVEVASGEIKVSKYPNPFRQRATIEYRVPAPGHVRLTVYDVLVYERQSARPHSAKLDASSWPSGVYLFRLEAGHHVATGRLVRHKQIAAPGCYPHHRGRAKLPLRRGWLYKYLYSPLLPQPLLSIRKKLTAMK